MQAGEYARSIRRHWVIVLAIAFLAVDAAAIGTALTPKQYSATAKVLMTGSEPIDMLQVGGARSLDPERDLNTSVELVNLQAVARPVRDELRLPMGVADLLATVRAAPERNSNVIAITSQDRDPSRAAAIANAFARRYVVFRREAARIRFKEAASLAQLRLDALPDDARSAPLRRELRARLHDLETSSSLQTGGLQLVDSATKPSAPSSPRMKLNLAAGLLVGLLLGCAFAVALSRVATIRRKA